LIAIFYSEQFDTDLPALWVPHAVAGLCDHGRAKWLTLETEEFDRETLHILGNALDEAWRRVKPNRLNGRAYGARTVLAQHIFAMAKQGERDPLAETERASWPDLFRPSMSCFL
jgi:hypothetical protein